MAEQFYTILTNTGKAKIANALPTGAKVNLTKLKVGDSNGAYYNPSESQTDLVHTVYTCSVTSVEADKNNPSWITITAAIPSDVGGFSIREVGVFDDKNSLIAIGKYPETYKPVASDGSTKELYIKMTLEVTNASSVDLKIDPTVIIATKKDINNLQEKIKENTAQLSEIMNVLDLFVINDGTTDNTAIIQTALDRSNHVKISKKGTYITRRLTIHDNTTFELSDGVILKQKDNNSDYIIVNDKWRATDGTYNTNIKIIGGQYDINASKNPRTGAILEGLYAGIGIVLNNVRNLEVRNIKEIGNALKYCFLFANIENGIFENINCINQSDGLHFQAPCKNIKVSNITGTCHDNLIAFTIGDYPSIVISEDGDFDNIEVKNVYSKGETIDIIRLIGDGKSGKGSFRNISIDNIKASCPNSAVVELGYADQSVSNVYLNKTVINNIKISSVFNNSQTKSNLINVGSLVGTIEISNIYASHLITGSGISVTDTADIKNLIINNSFFNQQHESYMLLTLAQNKSAIQVTFENCVINSYGRAINYRGYNGGIVKFNNCKVEIKKLINIENGGLVVQAINSSFDVTRAINKVDFITIADNSSLSFLENRSTFIPYFNFKKGSTSKVRLDSDSILYNGVLDSISPTEYDVVKTSSGIYEYVSARWTLKFKTPYKFVQALDFGTIQANSFAIREVDLSDIGNNVSHDLKWGIVANAYNGTGESNNVTYCAWLKDNKAKIRVSNLSSSPIAIKCDWLIKLIK